MRRQGILATFGLVTLLGAAEAQPIPPTLPAQDPGSNIQAICRSGNTLYVGGTFDALGPPTGGGVSVSTDNAQLATVFPKVAGTVRAVVEDGRGGWYIGGSFTAVGGVKHRNLAHITAAGGVATWDPANELDIVDCLALRGTALYVGGFLSDGAGQWIGLKCFDGTTGAPLAAIPRVTGSYDVRVHAIAVSESIVYIGGKFSEVGGVARRYLAAFDASSGAVREWDPDPDAYVSSLQIVSDSILVGGYFWNIGGQVRRCLAKLDRATGQAGAWNAGIDRIPVYTRDDGPHVTCLAVADSIVYAGGSFNRVGGQTRTALAAIGLQSGAVLPWDPQATGYPPGYVEYPRFNAIQVRGDRVLVAGKYQSIGGRTAVFMWGEFVASLDRASGSATDWQPRCNGEVYALAEAGGMVYLGGAFTCVGEWKIQRGVAALDAMTGSLKPWYPGVDGFVKSIAVRGDTVFLGGDFGVIGGETRVGIAAVSATDARVLPWNASANGTVLSLIPSGGLLYVGGWFTQIGGQTRPYVAALDASGHATAWNPQPNDYVNALIKDGATLYMAGLFSYVGGSVRVGVAAADTSGVVLPFDANSSGYVDALASLDGGLFVGSYLGSIGGTTRNAIAALDPITGAATAWDADVDPAGDSWVPGGPVLVWAIAGREGVVYFGGLFGRVGSASRNFVAAVDARSAAVLDWNPEVTEGMSCIVADSGWVYLGGSFDRVGTAPCYGLAAVAPAEAITPNPQPATLTLWAAPNPVRGAFRVTYTLPEAAPVTLSIYDLQGRCVADLLDHATFSAGLHEVPVGAGQWRPGVYLCRLETGARSATKKIVILQ